MNTTQLPEYFKTECHYYRNRQNGVFTQVYTDEGMVGDVSIVSVSESVFDFANDDFGPIPQAEYEAKFNEALEILKGPPTKHHTMEEIECSGCGKLFETDDYSADYCTKCLKR